MILLHRLKGEPLVVNADLIESVESTPDTVLTLVDGRRLLCAESPEELVDQIVMFRARVLAAADRLRDAAADEEAPVADLVPLALVADAPDESAGREV